ncbi:MAG: hypothetical protein SFX74_00930 [Fimbriimonadaceae bacterium]|nr:hypothetical protein [Fimbriimonadaceae bacterium]
MKLAHSLTHPRKRVIRLTMCAVACVTVAATVGFAVVRAQAGTERFDYDRGYAELTGIPVQELREVRRFRGRLRNSDTLNAADWARLITISRHPNGELREEAFTAIQEAHGTGNHADALREVERMKDDPALRASYAFAVIALQAPDWKRKATEMTEDRDPVVAEVSRDALARVPMIESVLARKAARTQP